MNTSGQNGRGRSSERVQRGPGRPTCYGCIDPVLHEPRGRTPSQHPAAAPIKPDREPKEVIDPNACFACTFVLLIIVAFVSFYFLCFDAVAQFRVQREAMLEEAKHLEYERQSLERERLVLKEERERWEKSHEDSRIPQGAFWEVVWPKWECRAYGKREYWGILRNIPQDRNDLDACMNMPVEIKGVTIKRPDRCLYEEGSSYVHGFWMVDWDQPDCKPWHKYLMDKGCTNPGSGIRRIEAELAGINRKGQQDWYVLCETTPMTWDHITYSSPTHCDERDDGKKIAMWDIPDSRC